MPVVALALRLASEKELHEWESSISESLRSVEVSIVLKELLEFIDFYNKGDKLEVYFQPRPKGSLIPTDTDGIELFSFEVYRSKTECAKDFPNYDIDTFIGQDIEEHTYRDLDLTDDGEPKFTIMDLDYETNIPDLLKSLDKLVGIVDENKGGIVAYAIGQEHADFIVDTLERTREQFVE